MIGESVLSLLINATTEERDYYVIAVIGVLTVIILMAIKFESQPIHAYHHALWQNIHNATCFSVLIQVLSMGLIAFGVSYKVFLTSVLNETADSETSRRLASIPKVSEEAAAGLFTISLTVVLVSIELMMLTHTGIKKAYGKLFRDIEQRRLHMPPVITTLVKSGTILFLCTVSQLTTDETLVAIIGFVVVLVVAFTRVLGWGFVNDEDHIREKLGGIAPRNRTAKGETPLPKVSFAGEKGSGTGDKAVGGSGIRDVTGVGEADGKGLSKSNLAVKQCDAVNRVMDDTSYDSIIVVDRQSIIQSVNKTAITEFGYDSKDDLVGQTLNLLIGSGMSESHDEYVQNFFENGGTSRVVGKQRLLRAKRKDGSEFQCIIGIHLLDDTPFVVGYIRNIQSVVDSFNRQ